MTEDTLITKYRPNYLEEIYGHREAVASIENTLANGLSRSFLFTGPSGIGKTTLARIIGKSVGAEIRERNAAEYASVKDMRALLQDLRHVPLFGENVCIILNEVQGLSREAWDSLLMSIEEPPSWLYWCLTTTEPSKAPATINRCLRCDLKPLDTDDLIDLLTAINDAERLKTSENILSLCARHAQGSPRLAISSLAVVASASSYEEAAHLLEEAEKPADAVELARILTKGGGWDQIQPILERLAETNAESIRYTVIAYMTKVILGNKKLDPSHVAVLQAFGQTPTFPASTGLTSILLAITQIL